MLQKQSQTWEFFPLTKKFLINKRINFRKEGNIIFITGSRIQSRVSRYFITSERLIFFIIKNKSTNSFAKNVIAVKIVFPFYNPNKI